jgi:hypothetical protein
MSLQHVGVLGSVIGAACLAVGCGSKLGTEPDPVPARTPAPPPILIKQGSLGVLTAGSTTGTSFSTNVRGTLRVNLDWTATGNETTVDVSVMERSFEGACAPGCEREDLCPSNCRTEIESWIDLATHPASLQTTSTLGPSNYELHVSYYDPRDYLLPIYPGMPPRVLVSYQIFLNPAASSASDPVP